MLGNVLEQITLAEVQGLVDEKVQEGKTIEFKSGMYQLSADNPDFRNKQRLEFLKDVSSFANTVGGDLVIGIDEQDGVAQSVCGADAADPDNLKLTMLQLLEKWIEPRMGCGIHFIHSGNKYVFVVRVPRSILAPHRVIYNGEFGQFWARNSGGAFQMDTSQLRQAFTLTETLFDKIARYRTDRVERIGAGNTPILMPNGAKLILQLIPLESFAGRLAFTPSELDAAFRLVGPLAFNRGHSTRINLDGIAKSDYADLQNPSNGCVQVYRNGIVEVIADDITYSIRDDGTGARFFRTHHLNHILECLPKYLESQKALGIPLPIWCFLTLTGVKGIGIRVARDFNPKPAFDRDTFWLPEIEITDYAANPFSTMKTLFEMIWNAGGYDRCYCFDANGKWLDLG